MSKSRRAATDADRPRYPGLREEIGEDPARYLVEPDATTWAVIRGINDEDRLDAWYAVEEDLGPRQEVIQALNERRIALAGDRDE